MYSRRWLLAAPIATLVFPTSAFGQEAVGGVLNGITASFDVSQAITRQLTDAITALQPKKFKKKDRKAIRDQLANIREFDGITGKMSFNDQSGDPIKCAVVVKISPAGKFEFYRMVCP